MLSIGMIIENRYKIIREIGRGGTSCVYLAENIRLHNYWAVKEVYKNSVVGSAMSSNKLIAESSILTKLRHLGLPTIVDVIDTPTSYLVIMEYIEGVSLEKVLQHGAQTESNVIKWGCQLCDVLEYLHSQNPPIIYRDMKPANVMLRPDGNVVLVDFGMAREFKQSSIHDTTNLGTHGYAAPEQYGGNRQTDARTDIYSLGVTLYHLVTNHDPCLPPYGVGSIRNHNPSLSAGLDNIIRKCTSLRPEDRFQSAYELKNALCNVNSFQTFDTFYEPEEPKKKSKAWMWSLLAIPVVIIAVVLGITLGGNSNGSSNHYFSDLCYEQEVYIGSDNESQMYYIEAEKSGYYEFSTESSSDVTPIVWLYDSDENLLMKDNTTGLYEDVYFSYWLEAGETYYVEANIYPDGYYASDGSFTIYVYYVD